MKKYNIRPIYIAIIILIILNTIQFYHILFDDYSIAHGDSIIHSLSLQHCLSESLKKHTIPLWTDKLFGGHPIFAESQGGFLHPINLILFSLLPVLKAHNVFHWLVSIIGGLGVFCLCRTLKLSFYAALFGGLACSFSSGWIATHHNATIMGTLIWVPWMLMAMEKWQETPKFSYSLYLAIGASLMIFSGYPQIPHGVMVIIFLHMTIYFIRMIKIEKTATVLLPYFLYGMLAIFIAVGITAVQTLPLMELVPLSHRHDSINLISIAPQNVFKGLLFANFNENIEIFPTIGSMLIFILSLSSIIFSIKNFKILSYCLSALFLFLMGTAGESYSFLFFKTVIPGYTKFQILHPYLMTSIVIFSVLAAFTLDKISEHRENLKKIVLFFGIYAIIIIYAFIIWQKELPFLQIMIAIVSLCVILILNLTKRHKYIKIILLVLLVFEIFFVKFHHIHFLKNSYIDQPPKMVTYIKEKENVSRFKIMNVTLLPAYVFLPAYSSRIETGIPEMISTLTASTGLIWGIPSLQTNLALPLERRVAIHDILFDELSGNSCQAFGNRLIDRLGVKYIVSHNNQRIDRQLFKKTIRTTESSFLFENPHCKPKFQFYKNAIFVKSYNEAIEKLKTENIQGVIIETDKEYSDNKFKIHPDKPNLGAHFKIIKETSESYLIELTSHDSGYFFIADANYPGWEAFIDDKKTKIYTANILGKAIKVDPGTYTIKFNFQSRSFLLGKWISLITLAILLIICPVVYCCKNKFR